MDTIKGIDIPENHVEFAKAVSELADKFGMDKFEMTYRPKYGEHLDRGIDRRVNGDMKIHYSAVDGRGRPSRNLTINCEARLALDIERNPSS
jgi:hypothetical protein